MERGLSKNCLNLHISSILIVFVAAILTDSLTHGQAVSVEPNTALLNEGDKTELLCRFGRPINYCRIEIPGEKVLNLSPDWNKTPGFTYYGAGLMAGQCGVSIERVSAKHNGQVKCSLGVEGEELAGTIDLVVALRPHQPVIEVQSKHEGDGSFNEGSTFQARCVVRDGRPAANISWFIDDKPSDKRVSQMEVVDSSSDRNMTLSTTSQQIQWQLSPEDNGRKLICRSHHQTDREGSQPQEGYFMLHVRYAPIQQPETVVYGLYLEKTALINVTIRAYPAPSVEWIVDGVTVTPQGTQNGRYSASEPQHIGDDFYNVTLVIAGLSLEDTMKFYQLKASNALGVQEYSVRISSSSTPPVTGMDIGSIVGIVVALAVLIVIVLLVIFARATGRWCFGGKTIKSPTSETATAAAAAAAAVTQHPGQSVALLETLNGVTIIGNNHRGSTNEKRSKPTNGHDRLSVVIPRTHDVIDDDDNSFEYGTDRESSVYNPTTMPAKSIMAAAGGRNSQKPIMSDTENTETTWTTEGSDLLTRGNQLGIPESRFARWIPKDQREILEKQAKLLVNRVQPKPTETEI